MPYQFEPVPNENMDNSGSENGSSASDSSDEDDIDKAFKAANGWRLNTLNWCKCGQCTLQIKTIESFCCHEKALQYDEYDTLVNEAESTGHMCLTDHPEFSENMLSENVLKVDIFRYLEENWPV